MLNPNSDWAKQNYHATGLHTNTHTHTKFGAGQSRAVEDTYTWIRNTSGMLVDEHSHAHIYICKLWERRCETPHPCCRLAFCWRDANDKPLVCTWLVLGLFLGFVDHSRSNKKHTETRSIWSHHGCRQATSPRQIGTSPHPPTPLRKKKNKTTSYSWLSISWKFSLLSVLRAHLLCWSSHTKSKIN